MTKSETNFYSCFSYVLKIINNATKLNKKLVIQNSKFLYSLNNDFDIKFMKNMFH